jgi:hypothetical protein
MADIVERLRDDFTILVDAATEIERLRGALRQILAIEDSYTGGDWDEIEEARLIARDALA